MRQETTADRIVAAVEDFWRHYVIGERYRWVGDEYQTRPRWFGKWFPISCRTATIPYEVTEELVDREKP